MSDYLDPGNEELLKDFFDEADQQVSLFEQNILAIETDPGNAEAIDEMFRAAHTLKGAAATVQMAELASFTHIVEDVLDEIREGKIQASDVIIEMLLQSIDTIKIMLERRSKGGVFDENIDELIDALKKAAGLPLETVALSSGNIASKREVTSDTLSEYQLLELLDETEPGSNLYRVDVTFDESNPMNTVGGIQVFAALRSVGTVVASTPVLDKLYEDVFFETVHYFVASEETERVIASNAAIDDVTLGVTVTILKDAEKEADSRETAESGSSGAESREKPVRKPRDMASPRESSRGKEAKPAPDAEIQASEAAPASIRAGKRAEAVSGGSILRVDSRRIDTLLNLVSEAVINKAAFNQINQSFVNTQEEFQQVESEYQQMLKALFDSAIDLIDTSKLKSDTGTVRDFLYERFGALFGMFSEFENMLKDSLAAFRNTSQNLARITGELQEGVMQIRMVPISQIFSRFPRLVRDVAKTLDKSVNLEIIGEDTELDKSVIEDLLDPLIHCVRNSIDHGIESPAEREEAGKSETGTVVLRAGNEGNLIVIEIEDDGKGINIDSVYQKAVDRGVIHPSKQLTDIEAYNLIFEPGFSTAERVTDISGRGVGLDVVRKQIEKLNGTVNVWSEYGAGTRITIKLPLTLAILQGLLVRVGSEVYAVPIASVVESHRITPGEIRRIDNYEVMDVREEVVSLLRLSKLFRIDAVENPKHHYVVVVGSEKKKVGLIVDSLIGEEDVVIKPLKDRFTNTPGIAGATILGDGRVALIIDVSQLLDLGMAIDNENRKKRSKAIM